MLGDRFTTYKCGLRTLVIGSIMPTLITRKDSLFVHLRGLYASNNRHSAPCSLR